MLLNCGLKNWKEDAVQSHMSRMLNLYTLLPTSKAPGIELPRLHPMLLDLLGKEKYDSGLTHRLQALQLCLVNQAEGQPSKRT